MDERRILTSSRLSAIRRCMRYHYLRYELGISKDREATALRMGTVYHQALDILKGGNVSDAQNAIDTFYNEKTVPEWSGVNDWLCEGAKLRALIEIYGSYHAREDRPIFSGEVIASEMEFVIPIKNPETGRSSTNFILSGLIDKLIKLEDGRLAILEHKTTSDSISDGSDYWPRLRIDQQVSIYFLAAQWMGYDVQTILYDVTHKPGMSRLTATPPESRKYTKEGKLYANQRENDETPEEFYNRLREDIASRPGYYFARKEIVRTERDIDEFRAEMWQQQQLLTYCQKNGCWPRNSGACLMMGKCQFADICFQGLNPADGMVPGFKRLDSIHPELHGRG